MNESPTGRRTKLVHPSKRGKAGEGEATEQAPERQGPEIGSDTEDTRAEPHDYALRGSGRSESDRSAAERGPDVGAKTPARGVLRDDDIEAKTGNYIISFGFPGSGKTTFQSFLAYYLTHVGPFDAEPWVNPEETALGWDPLSTYNNWIRHWREGTFPRPTPVNEDDISELILRVRPHIGKRPEIYLGMLEASGELMQHIMAERSTDPNLAPTLYRYFANPKIHVTLVLFVDPDVPEENDLLFQNLLTFLDHNFPGIRDRLCLAVLVSKPQQSLQLMKQRRAGVRHYADLRGDLLQEFLAEVCPKTYQIIDNWPKQRNVAIMTLNIGEIEQNASGPKVRRKNFDDIASIFAALYRQITGETLEPRWWQKMLEWIRK